MQGVMIACLMPYYPLAELVLLLLFVKELTTMAAGWKVIMETEADLEAQWHGKLNTVVTYIVVLILTAAGCNDLPEFLNLVKKFLTSVLEL